MRKLAGCLAALAVLVGACGSVNPVPIRAGDVCNRCRRVIEDTRAAAELVGADGMASTFRSAGCMAKYLAEHPEDKSAVFVTDFPNGRLVPPSGILFVPTLNRETGERDYLAYAVRQAADAAVKEWNAGTPVDWTTVVENARKAARGN